jgi:hypothetical protein
MGKKLEQVQARIRMTFRIACAWVIVGVSAGAPARADDASSAGYSLFDPVPDQDMRAFCTDRPTKGTGPCTVDAGHLQIESDIFNFTSQDSGGATTYTYVYTSPNFRLGLTDNLDAEVNVSPYVEIVTHDHATGTRTELSGFGDTIFRLKYSIVGNGSGDFSAALDPWLKLPTASDGIGNGAVEGGAVVPLQFTLSDVWSLSAVPEIDLLKNSDDDGRHFAGVLALGITRTLSETVSASAELWGNIDGDPAGTQGQYSFDVAATWQPPGTKDLQFDAGANFGLNNNTPGQQYYVGVSHRF